MFGSSIIDIAIGIVFVFLLVSVIASTMNEIILSFLNMRGKELLAGLQTLLDDADASGLVSKLYNHGQVFGLFKGSFDPKKTGNLPAYIPAQNFVMAFLDIVPAAAQLSTAGERKAKAVAAAVGAAGASVAPVTAPPVTAVANDQTTAPIAPAASQSGSQIGLPASDAPQPGASPAVLAQEEAMFKSLWAAAHKLASDPSTEKVGKPLIAMLDAAGNDAAALKKSIEDWYNSAMDRVSGWYKYRTQWILFWLGLALAVSLNANCVSIVQQLSKDSALRQSVVAAAGAAKLPGTVTSAADQIKSAQTQVDAIDNLGIPLGWTHTAALWDFNDSKPDGHLPQKLTLLLGWLLTAFAVSLGAPFWFDLLNKIMVVRSTVKPREKSQDEASKDN